MATVPVRSKKKSRKRRKTAAGSECNGGIHAPTGAVELTGDVRALNGEKRDAVPSLVRSEVEEKTDDDRPPESIVTPPCLLYTSPSPRDS